MANKTRRSQKLRGQKPNPDRPNDMAAPSSHSRTAASDRQRRRSKSSNSPQNRFERYVALAQAEALAGDAVASESHYQRAEHFFRMMNKKSVRHSASETTRPQADRTTATTAHSR